ncbi:MAG: hypothetical protein K0R12_423 [Gammaproteobacteria bacterium]|nr:hypothetical protein [Gammaproteobacteria bacterium]
MFGQKMPAPNILSQDKRKRVERSSGSSTQEEPNTSLLPLPPLKRTRSESHEQSKQAEIKSILRGEHTESEPSKTKSKKHVLWIQEHKAPISQFFTIPALRRPTQKENPNNAKGLKCFQDIPKIDEFFQKFKKVLLSQQSFKEKFPNFIFVQKICEDTFTYLLFLEYQKLYLAELPYFRYDPVLTFQSLKTRLNNDLNLDLLSNEEIAVHIMSSSITEATFQKIMLKAILQNIIGAIENESIFEERYPEIYELIDEFLEEEGILRIDSEEFIGQFIDAIIKNIFYDFFKISPEAVYSANSVDELTEKLLNLDSTQKNLSSKIFINFYIQEVYNKIFNDEIMCYVNESKIMLDRKEKMRKTAMLAYDLLPGNIVEHEKYTPLIIPKNHVSQLVEKAFDDFIKNLNLPKQLTNEGQSITNNEALESLIQEFIAAHQNDQLDNVDMQNYMILYIFNYYSKQKLETIKNDIISTEQWAALSKLHPDPTILLDAIVQHTADVLSIWLNEQFEKELDSGKPLFDELSEDEIRQAWMKTAIAKMEKELEHCVETSMFPS